MNKNSILIGFAVAGLVVAGIFGYAVGHQSQLGGDYAGGITPSQLFTGNVGTNSVTPALSNLFVNGSVSVSGQAANNQVTALFTATSAYKSAAVTLGPLISSTSTATTTVPFTASGFSIGDACEVSYNGTGTSTSPFGADAFVTAVNGNAVSATVTFWNGGNTNQTLTVTSTITGASSTVKTTCFHPGV